MKRSWRKLEQELVNVDSYIFILFKTKSNGQNSISNKQQNSPNVDGMKE